MDTYCGGGLSLILLILFKVHAIELGADIGCAKNMQFTESAAYNKTADMTNDKCARFCCSSSTNVRFMGTQNGEECYCKTELTNLWFAHGYYETCTTTCGGNRSQICGGKDDNHYYMSLFLLDCSNSNVSQPTKEQLQVQLEELNRNISFFATLTSSQQLQLEGLRTENAILMNSTNSKQVKLEELNTKISICTNSTHTQRVQLEILKTDITTYKNATSSYVMQLTEIKTDLSICRNSTLSKPTNKTLNKQQLEIKLKELKTEIAIDKKRTTIYKSKKHCTTDNRKSARNLGILGCIVLVLPVVLMVGNDLLNAFKKVKIHN